MMDTSLLSDVVVYSVQVACVVAIGGVLTAIVRIDAADVRYFYWRSMLALCLALPWLQVRQTVTSIVAPAPQVQVASSSEHGAAVDASAIPAPTLTGSRSSDGSSSTGMVIRLAGIGIGFWRLRRLRTAGVPRSAL